MSRQAVYGHGPTERELEFVELREDGLSVAEAAAKMGIGILLARDIEARMFPTGNDDAQFRAMIRQGSLDLAARIEAVHGGRAKRLAL